MRFAGRPPGVASCCTGGAQLSAMSVSGGNGMDAESTLEAIAEIAISITGFAGIVGALAGEKLSRAHPGVWLPFWVMISSGLCILFTALFPFVPYHLGAPDRVSWAVSSAVLAALTACSVAFFMPRISRAQRDGALVRMPAFDVSLRVCAFFVVVSQVLNMLGVGLPQSAGGLLIGLYLSLLISGLNFAFLLNVLGRPRGGPPAA